MQTRKSKNRALWLGAILSVVGITSLTGTTWAANNAQYISQNVPTSVTAGSRFGVWITMKNTGTTTWSGSHRLGSQNPGDNTTWGTHRVYLPNDVPPGSEVTFSLTASAPTTPGTYNFQWRMLEEAVEWFGDLTPNVAITVEAGTALTPELANVGHGFFCIAKHEGTGEMWAGTFGDEGGGTSARLYVRRNGSWQLHSDFSSGAESIYRLIYHPASNKLYANMERWTKSASIYRLDGDTWNSTGYGNGYSESSKTMGLGMGVGADGYIYATTSPMDEVYEGKGYTWRSLDGTNWSSFPDPGAGHITAYYYGFNGQTYAVTSFGGGSSKLLRLSGTTWQTLYSNANLRLYYLIGFKGALYMSGEEPSTYKAVMYRWDGTNCQRVYESEAGPGTGGESSYFQQMAIVKDSSNTEWLYAGYSLGWRFSGTSAVFRSNDGTTWSCYQAFPNEAECWAVATGETDHTLYVGTKNQGGGGRIYRGVFSAEPDIIIDNTSGSFSCSANWSTGTSSTDKYGANYRFRSTEAVSDAAQWTPNITAAGNWSVYAWWPQGANRSATAPYQVTYNGGTATVSVNQQTNGGKWNLLGTWSFGAGTGYPTRLSCWTTTGYVVMADAIKWVFIKTPADTTAPAMSSVTDDMYTTSTTTLNGSWGASDPDTGIQRYEYAVGTTSGGIQLKGWTSAGTATSAAIGGLSLTVGETYYISARAVNGANLTSTPMPSSGVTVAHSVASIADAKALDDTDPVALPATSTVSAKFTGYLYVEDPTERASGIRVQSSAGVVLDQTAQVFGRLTLLDGLERALTDCKVVPGAMGTAVQPLEMVTKCLGGEALNAHTPGVLDGIGPNNVGLLVTIIGTVKDKQPGYIYVSDGSDVSDGTGNVGVRVDTTYLADPPEINKHVVITGISTVYETGTAHVRMVRPRSDADVTPYD